MDAHSDSQHAAPLTARRRLGLVLRRYLPVNGHVFAHLRLEADAAAVTAANRLLPSRRQGLARLRSGRDLRVNVGCGPFGRPGWVNLDLYSHPCVTTQVDCRRALPLADSSCIGIHVEHFAEHLDPANELPNFLAHCRRCLTPRGVLRVIVPDAGLYVRAYLEPGWAGMNAIGCGGDVPEREFRTKMDALNHVFLQGWEHYGGFDAERLEAVLRDAGFPAVRRRAWREGDFPGGCIDRDQHRSYSLYYEALR